MVDKSAPQMQLHLDWVYGYRGHQCRNNLYYTDSSEIVYFAAGVGIVCNAKYNKQKFFLGHNDDIISLAVHPEGRLVATGQVGSEPYTCIWDSTSCTTVSILNGNHEKGIACIGFNATGTHLLTVGLEEFSLIVIWDWKKGKALSTVKGHNDRIFDACFNPFKDNELVSCGVKHIKFWKFCGNTLTGEKGVFGQKGEIQTVLCASYGTGGALYTGTLSGDIYKWQDNVLLKNVPSAHSGAVFTIHSTSDGYATGSKDGTVALWDIEFKSITKIDFTHHSLGYSGISIRSVCWGGDKILVGTNGGEVFEVSAADKDKPITVVQGHGEGELWGLAVHPKKVLFATGSDDHTVRLWDSSSKILLAKTAFDVASRSIAFSPDGLHMAVGHSDGSFRILKGRDLSEYAHIHDRQEVIHELKYSPDGTLLAVGSNDNFVDIYSAQEKYKRIGQCKGNTSYITHIDWSEDSAYIQTNSGVGERMFFKVPVGKKITRKEEIENIHWQTWTSVLGPEVNGICEHYSDTNDVNAADANFLHGVLVTGDDFGLVKVYRFPCIKKGANFRKYVGHSAHVTNVRFSSDGRTLFSIGGEDHAIFQWTVVPEGNRDSDLRTSIVGGTYVESDNEASDSDLSDVDPLDSDIEEEIKKDYHRDIYKEDIARIQMKMRKDSTGSSSGEIKKARPNAPSQGLRLRFVFGYRGYDCRNNLCYTQSSEIVYHVAAVGIVYRKESHTQRFYSGHDDDILCLTLHPIKDIVATGQIGRDPTIHIWDTDKLETLSILKGHHQCGVCALDFSGDGKKLASIGLDSDHSIVIWDWRRGEKLAISKGHIGKIFEIRWDPMSIDKLVTVGVKHIVFWVQVGGGLTSKKGMYGEAGKHDTMMCVTYAKSASIAVTGGATGNLYIWAECNLKRTIQAHRGPVYVLQALEKGYVSGGKDGIVCLWDEELTRCLKSYKINQANLTASQPKYMLLKENPCIRAVTLGQGKILIGTINGQIMEIDKKGPVTSLIQGHGMGELWGLCISPSDHLFVSMGEDHTLQVWDVHEKSLIKCRNFGKPGRCCAFSTDGKAIAVGFNDGSIIVVTSDTLDDIIGFHHHKEEISDLKFSPGEGKYLAVACHDQTIDIYNVFTQTRVGICKGASSYITHIDWDADGRLLQANTGAGELLYFKAPRGTMQPIPDMQRSKISWASWTCVLGKECEGIWMPGAGVDDVNATCLRGPGLLPGKDQGLGKSSSLLATADDYGVVKLFEFPTEGKNAKCKKYHCGHAAQVTNVRWSYDGSYLVTTGGSDTSIMLWELVDDTVTGSASHVGEDSDTDSEEDYGFDSDVEYEKNLDYTSKIYTSSIRETSGVKPQSQEEVETQKKIVSRGSSTQPKVQRKESLTVDGRKIKQAEINKLELDFVHGYRGFDTRNNLHYIGDEDIVYHAASAVIVYNLQTKTQSFYLQHTDDIICLALNQNPKFKNVVASGQIGIQPAVHVWDIITKKTLAILEGYHQKGICSLHFSSSGRYLVTVGLDNEHSIAVWRWADGTKIACSTGSVNRIFVAEFRPDSDTSFVSCGVNHIMWWNVAGSALVKKKGNLSSFEDTSMQTMLSVAYGPNDITFTGAMSGDVYVWLSNALTRVVKAVHNGPVFSMFTTVKDGLIVTGGKDNDVEGGCVKLWDQEMKRNKVFKLSKDVVVKSVFRSALRGTILIGTKSNEILELSEKSGLTQILISGHGDGEMWGLSVHPTSNIFATSSDDGTVRTWDIFSKKTVNMSVIGVPVRCCDYSSDGNYLAIGLKTGEFQLLDPDTLNSITSKRDRKQAITQVKFTADSQILVVSSEEKSVDFYTLKPVIKRIGYCKNLSAVVSQLDISADAKHIQVCTNSYERLIFAIPDGTQVTDNIIISGIVWDSWSCTLGSDVIGIWPKNAEAGDVNCAHLSSNRKTLVTGDDFGFVKLFHFPVSVKYTKGERYVGHSAHVTNVRFSHDDKYVLSTGGDDCCVFVWKCS